MSQLSRCFAVLFATALLLSTAACSQTAAPAAKAYMSDFADVTARLTQVAKEQSVNGTTITIGATTDEPDGKRVVTARRVTDKATTDYTMRFHKPAARWVCARADAEEIETTGGKKAFKIEGNSIEIEQLIAWLQW